MLCDWEDIQLIVDGESLGWSWPVELNGVTFSAPIIILGTEDITLMGKVDLGFSIVVTIVTAPEIDADGLFVLNLKKIKAGALNITKFAKGVGGRIMAAQVKDLENDQWLKDLSDAFLKNKPYEPIYPVPTYRKDIRLSDVLKQDKKLILKFEPGDEW